MDKNILRTKTFWTSLVGIISAVAAVCGIAPEVTEKVSGIAILASQIFIRSGIASEINKQGGN